MAISKNSLTFLKSLLETPSPSGYETRIQKQVYDRLTPWSDQVDRDVHGNVIATRKGSGSLSVMLVAHCDEIGLLITHIDDKGYIFVAALGGVDPRLMPGQQVLVHGKETLPGVIGRRYPIAGGPEKGVPSRMSDIWIDVGAKSRKELDRLIAIGDVVTVRSEFTELRNQMVASRAFDDRIGVFVLTEAFRRIKGKVLNADVHVVSSVQEEVGLRGVQTSGFVIQPDVGIAVDVGFCSDHPGPDCRSIGEIALGKGPVIARGPSINPVVFELLQKAAKAEKIPIQVAGEARTSTDADALQIVGRGVATGLISIPTRYIHSPSEVISLKDVENASRLLSAFLMRLQSNQSFLPF